MVAWSLEKFVPPPTPCPGAPRDECYFVFYARGTGRGEKITFWIEMKVSSLPKLISMQITILM